MSKGGCLKHGTWYGECHLCQKEREDREYREYRELRNRLYGEIETLRAKLEKADRLAEQAAITISYAYYMEPAFYLGLESSLKEYRGEETK